MFKVSLYLFGLLCSGDLFSEMMMRLQKSLCPLGARYLYLDLPRNVAIIDTKRIRFVESLCMHPPR
jgi:hypothetical protein